MLMMQEALALLLAVHADRTNILQWQRRLLLPVVARTHPWYTTPL